MKTLVVIFILALSAIAAEFYTDALFTGAEVAPGSSELPMMQGQSHAPILGF